ncbi:MAG: tetratricopeptide repeat protein, partial [Bryobacterales bacterium]|nr:tetratricopeptide repeat protein [Bryobacterales bacterium]
MFTRIAIPVLLVVGLLAGQDGPRARQRAYQAMQQGEVGVAVDAFREATVATPLDAALRKDFAYALLKVGDSTAARDQFAEAARLNSKDSHAALEYAFLCHETGKQPEAWALFRKLRNAPDPEHRATARATFDRLDAELRTTIARLQEALARNPSDDSGHVELARTYTVRNEFAKAAAHFEAAFRLKPGIPSLLLDLQGAALTAGDLEKARAAALAASRSASAYVAEQARALLPARYPYLYEFQNALALDAGNTTLRREMGFFLLSLNRREEASAAFQQVIADAPRDPLANAQFGFLLWEDGKRAEALPRLRVAQAEGDATLRSRVDGLLAEGAPAGAGNEFPAREEMPAKAVAPGGTMPADTPVPSVETPVQPADTPASPTSR